MGLLLSILVSCVGVIELIAFYSHLRRCLIVGNEVCDLETLACNYKRMLTREYRLMFAEVNGKDVQPKSKTNFALSPSPKAIFGSEDIDNSFQINAESRDKEHICCDTATTSATTNSPNTRYDINENHTNTASTHANSVYNFLENNHIPNQNDINYNSFETNDTLKYEITCSKSAPVLPSQFNTISEQADFESTLEKPAEEKVTLTAPPLINNEHLINIGYLAEATNGETSADIEKIYLQEESIADFISDRCPSPFPTYERLAPRGSVCSELLDDPISVQELLEDEVNLESEFSINNHHDVLLGLIGKSIHKSRSLSPNERIRHRRSLSPVRDFSEEIYFDRRHRSASPCKRFATEEDFLLQQKRSKSSSDVSEIILYAPAPSYHIIIEDCWGEAPSPLEQFFIENNEESRTQQFVLVEEIFDEDFKNSLDGVKNTNEDRKRQFKRKRNARQRSGESSFNDEMCSISQEAQDVTVEEPILGADVLLNEEGLPSSNSIKNKDVSSQNVLLQDENIISEDTQSSTTGACSKDVESKEAAIEEVNIPGPSKEEKKPEAFWVN